MIRRLIERFRPTRRSPLSAAAQADYAALYEAHAASEGDPRGSIGEGDFERAGAMELAILRAEGLQPSSALLDFGCGVGRLALHAIPYLEQGRYVGVDIAPTMIRNARAIVGERLGRFARHDYRFEVNAGEDVARFGADFDFVCAYSVFTHMESEDTFRYMKALAQVLKPRGRLVCSVLPLETGYARQVFAAEAALAHGERWRRVRNVVTSFSMMERIASLAGYAHFRWYSGDEHCVRMNDGSLASLAQSALVADRL